MKTRVEIVSGFLGSGKTSFINSYLDTEVCANRDILIVLLEKGITEIQNKEKNIEVICLEKTEDLKEVLINKISKKKYYKVIVEYNGTEKLSLIGEIFKDKYVKNKYNFYGNYYIGNSNNLMIYLRNMGEIIVPFIKSSKLIVLNNIDLLDKKKQIELIKEVEEINNTAPIILSSSINKLSFDLKSSKYFKEWEFLKGINALFNRRGEKRLYDKMG